ncbi:DUF262 domain-containing HNH endonuclease family protein [Desulfobacterota bacterium AH_259_B03_O07]|nr:DUF262 domain-containing HNH endonuclease family protein [Desulfobacterota bacterium AH_259_B03_O07]
MAKSKYDVVSLTVEELLAPKQRLFEVPQFQRVFSWGKDEVVQLTSDLFSESNEADLPYFLGSIVVAGKEGANQSKTEVVLHGQQRLATISLIIAALIHRLPDAPDISEYKSYILSRKGVMDARRDPKLTLQQQDMKDFAALIQSPQSYEGKQYHQSKIAAALGCIFDEIDGYHEKEDGLPYEAMLRRLLLDVELVHIVTPTEQDAFRLFETLNDRGLSLSAADLIKNKLFSQCGETIEEAFEAWNTMLTSLGDEDVVDYLRYWWMASKAFTRSRGLYKTYQGHIDQLSTDDATLLALSLSEDAEKYAHIARPALGSSEWGEEVAEIMERLNTYRARSCRPVLLACSIHRPDWMPRVATICESITVRYSIVAEKNTNNLERVYARFCTRIREKNHSLSETFDASQLSEVPNDEEFKEKVATMEIRPRVPAWRTILRMVNDHKGTGETSIRGEDRVHIEHVLPQNPRLKALKEAGFATRDEASGYISRLGNLTLLSSKKNVKLSNKPFSEKKDMYEKSEIAMTRDLSSIERWSADVIDRKSTEYANTAALVFRHPVNIAEES